MLIIIIINQSSFFKSVLIRWPCQIGHTRLALPALQGATLLPTKGQGDLQHVLRTLRKSVVAFQTIALVIGLSTSF